MLQLPLLDPKLSVLKNIFTCQYCNRPIILDDTLCVNKRGTSFMCADELCKHKNAGSSGQPDYLSTALACLLSMLNQTLHMGLFSGLWFNVSTNSNTTKLKKLIDSLPDYYKDPLNNYIRTKDLSEILTLFQCPKRGWLQYLSLISGFSSSLFRQGAQFGGFTCNVLNTITKKNRFASNFQDQRPNMPATRLINFMINPTYFPRLSGVLQEPINTQWSRSVLFHADVERFYKVLRNEHISRAIYDCELCFNYYGAGCVCFGACVYNPTDLILTQPSAATFSAVAAPVDPICCCLGLTCCCVWYGWGPSSPPRPVREKLLSRDDVANILNQTQISIRASYDCSVSISN